MYEFFLAQFGCHILGHFQNRDSSTHELHLEFGEFGEDSTFCSDLCVDLVDILPARSRAEAVVEGQVLDGEDPVEAFDVAPGGGRGGENL